MGMVRQGSIAATWQLEESKREDRRVAGDKSMARSRSDLSLYEALIESSYRCRSSLTKAGNPFF